MKEMMQNYSYYEGHDEFYNYHLLVISLLGFPLVMVT